MSHSPVIRLGAMLLVAAAGVVTRAADTLVSDVPKPVPATRPEMKRLIEGLKTRQPRLPLPPPNPTETAGKSPASVVNNGRMRAYYLPESWHARNFAPDAKMTVDNTFKTRLFWIVSRLNNCHYCLGHQEHKLLVAGMLEDQIAALDSRWEAFPRSERAAMELARKMTITPHQIDDADIERLRPAFNDEQIIEIVQTIASNNSTNRWTDSLGIPQDSLFRDHPIELDTPTSPEFSECRTTVATSTLEPRGPLPSIDTLRAMLADAQEHPRVARVDYSSAAPVSSPQWLRALSAFPESAATMKRQWEAVEREGSLPRSLKNQLRWVVARENHAWYALSIGWQAFQADGVTWDQLVMLDAGAISLTPGDRIACEFARKLTTTPQRISDADIANLRKQFTDKEVAEIDYVICQANWFTRLTETLRLPLEP